MELFLVRARVWETAIRRLLSAKVVSERSCEAFAYKLEPELDFVS